MLSDCQECMLLVNHDLTSFEQLGIDSRTPDASPPHTLIIASQCLSREDGISLTGGSASTIDNQVVKIYLFIVCCIELLKALSTTSPLSFLI